MPVLFGSALNGFGVRRLLKALRHETPGPGSCGGAARRQSGCVFVFKVTHGGTMGRLAFARVFGGALSEGAELKRDGETVRVGTLFSLQGEKTTKLAKAETGEVVAIAKAEGVKAGEWLGARQGRRRAEIELPGAQLRARHRHQGPQGRRAAFDRAPQARRGGSRRSPGSRTRRFTRPASRASTTSI